MSDAAERGPALADERTLQVLDFDAIRRLVAHETMTDRKARARARCDRRRRATLARDPRRTVRHERDAVLSSPHDGFASAERDRHRATRRERAARGAPSSVRRISTTIAIAAACGRRGRAARPRRPTPPVLKALTPGATFRCKVRSPARIDHAIGDARRGPRPRVAGARLASGARSSSPTSRRATAARRSCGRLRSRRRSRNRSSRRARAASSSRSRPTSRAPSRASSTTRRRRGRTLFVEPLAALDANNRVRTLRVEEEREIERILTELSGVVGGAAGGLEMGLEILAEFDLSLARARRSPKKHGRGRAGASRAARYDRRLGSGRHPLLGERAASRRAPCWTTKRASSSSAGRTWAARPSR